MRPTAVSGSMRAARALSIRLMACAFSSTMVASGSATSARRHPWCSAVRQWSTAGSFKGGQRRIVPCPPLAHTNTNRVEFGTLEGTYHNLPHNLPLHEHGDQHPRPMSTLGPMGDIGRTLGTVH